MALKGKSIDRYRILEQLGQGGMAVVYKAYDTRLERDVALKVIRTEYIPPIQLKKLLHRFEREAKAQAQFIHANIVRVHDFGEYRGSPYLVMEYLPGGTLKAKTGNKLLYNEAARILTPIADALAYAHRRNVLHRDVKPSNIMITEEGKPMLGDFGIAKILEVEGTALTGTGMGIGTPEYMAPEQWRGEPVPQTDIYALGVVFYELVTGRKPYTADTPTAIALMQAMEPLPRPSELVPDLPEKVEKVLFKALALKPEDRYESMAAFREVLEELSWERQTGVADEPSEIPEVSPEDELASVPIQEQLTGSEPETSDDLAVVPAKVKEGKRVSRLWIGLGLLVIALVIAGGIGFLIFGDELAALQVTNTPTVTMIPTQSQTRMPTPFPTATIEPLVVERMKDRVPMVFVPAGEFVMGSEADQGYNLCLEYHTDTCERVWFENEEPTHTVYLDGYYIDQYEVTNRQFVQFVEETGYITTAEERGVSGTFDGNLWAEIEGASWKEPLGLVSDIFGKEDHPVLQVSWYDAKAYCEWAGVRLPTEAEWEKAARGGLEGMLYPWGNEEPTCTLGAENGAQFSYCDYGTVAVGSFAPNGFGVFDMAGNVWEWVADWYESSYYASSPAENPQGPSSGVERILRGGAWYFDPSGLLVSRRFLDYPDYTNILNGFRCASSTVPKEILSAESERTPTSSPQDDMNTRIRERDNMEMALIPAGEFEMGNEIVDGEGPVHTVYLDAYWIDKYEVTNTQYSLCVQSGECGPPNSNDFGNIIYDKHPVVSVNLYDVQAYCEWSGGRLPTEAEWEKAARGGLEGQLYPWGNQDPTCTFGAENGAQHRDCGGQTVEVGSFAPNGYGLFDMAGNVWEWVSDWYHWEYYLVSPAENPRGPSSGAIHVLRGGSWHDSQDYLRVARRYVYMTLNPNPYLGFRCVIDAN
jgi:formylglycine-generating enzyme required for sulfatase activity/tRNA A-37 threonylcarbamoyl transferase component Bud32